MASKKKLFIVESPAKAKTIEKILGKEYQVLASVGHIRDLKSKGRGKKTFGIDVENNYAPIYEIIPGKEKIIKELAAAAKNAPEVCLAPDPDREGEAIAWHLKELLEIPDDRCKRITYQAVTKRAITEALENPGEINMNLVSAQTGRRVLDRLVGFSLSPFLWNKVAKNLSAGRVQSVAVGIIVKREKEIKAFIPEEYWDVMANVSPSGKKKESFDASLVKWDGKRFALGNPDASTEESVKKIEKVLLESEYKITGIEKKQTKGKPPAPFITSTMQQAASTRLSFNPSKTMSVAQKLYEGMEIGDGTPVGLITYMRTDSIRIAPEALEEARNYISETFDKTYMPEKANIYSAGKKSQDAHEAIRPTNVSNTPEKLKSFLTKEQFKLYELIWKRFIASQMNPALFNITTITVQADKGIFEAKGRIVEFDGYTVLYPDVKKGKDEQRYQELPNVENDKVVDLLNLDATQNFTKPPNRYTEAGLVKALEKEGVGRPSTYAPIIKTIKERGYVRIESRSFYATELGIAVTGILEENFADIMALEFTAGMEDSLDEVERGEKEWVKVIDDFYRPFADHIKKATEEAEPLKNKPYEGEEKCPICSGDLLVRFSRNGAFLGCSNYPECKGLIPMPGEDGGDGEDVIEKDCPECGLPMITKTSRYGKKFLACSGYPDCKTTVSINKEGQPVELPKIDRKCEKCGKKMEVKSGRRGIFLACSGYPECKTTLPIDKDGKVVELPVVEGEVCEKCGSEMVVKLGRRGAFLACSGYPKCKNAKPLDKKEGEGDVGEAKDSPKDDKKSETNEKKTTKPKKTATKKTATKKTATKKTAAKKPAAKKKTDKETKEKE